MVFQLLKEGGKFCNLLLLLLIWYTIAKFHLIFTCLIAPFLVCRTIAA